MINIGFFGPYDEHVDFIFKKYGNGRRNLITKKKPDGHGHKNGRPWPSLGSTLPMANRYLFANTYLFLGGECNEAMSPSFAIRYVAIEGSSASLQALIATLLPACGTAKEAIFQQQ